MTSHHFRVTLFILFITLFTITAIITLLGVAQIITIKEGYLDTLFGCLIVELVASVIALFRSAKFFPPEAQSQETISSTTLPVISTLVLNADAGLVSSALLSLSELNPKYNDEIERVLSCAYSLLFRRLKILGLNEDGKVRPVSERADTFLRILSQSAKQNIAFVGDWKAEGTQNESAIHLGGILSKIEEFRIRSCGGIPKTFATRKASSSLVLIKALRASEPVFLMRWSGAWGGYYWFVGGIQEMSDNTLETCARRELREEIGLQDSDIQTLSHILTVSDKRISERVHVLTDYAYHLFSVAIDETSVSANKLLKSEFEIEKTIKGNPISQKCKWFTWEELKTSPDLLRDAGLILEAIERFGIQRIPFSFRTPVC